MGTLPMGGSRYGCLGTSHAQRRREGVDTLPMGGSRYGLLAKGGGSSHSQGGGGREREKGRMVRGVIAATKRMQEGVGTVARDGGRE